MTGPTNAHRAAVADHNSTPGRTRMVARAATREASAALFATRLQDPGRMTPKAHLPELGGLLARGFRSLQVSRKALAESAQAEALSCPAVDGNGAVSAAEETT